jgi:multidrug resistance efflux pump
MAEAEKQAAIATALEREAELAEFERLVAALEVRAPFDGAVAACHHDPGARVDAGVSLLRLITMHSLWVRFAVPSAESDWLKVGLIVRVQPERVAPNRRATIRRIAPEVDPSTDMIFVEASLVAEKGEGPELRSGEAVRVKPESLQEVPAE